MDKPRILYWGDSPRTPTGFGTVASNVIDHLLDDWKVDCLGITYDYTYSQDEWNHPDLTVRPVGLEGPNDLGRDKVIEFLKLKGERYDVMWILHDPFVVAKDNFMETVYEVCNEKGVKLFHYFPIDAKPRRSWMRAVMHNSDRAATYTDWGKQKCIDTFVHPEQKRFASKLEVIPHGVDKQTFKPTSVDIPERFEGQFLFGCVAANHRRKQLPRDVIQPFLKYRQSNPSARLLIKSQKNDKHGHHLDMAIGNYAKRYGVPASSIVLWNCDKHISDQQMNFFYNMIDCLVLLSHEGWGLPVTEAMATKTLTITPEYAALGEIGGGGRSIQVEKPDDSDHNIIMSDDNCVIRNLVDVDEAARAYKKAVEMENLERERIINEAYHTACLDWRKVAGMFDELFREMLCTRDS